MKLNRSWMARFHIFYYFEKVKRIFNFAYCILSLLSTWICFEMVDFRLYSNKVWNFKDFEKFWIGENFCCRESHGPFFSKLVHFLEKKSETNKYKNNKPRINGKFHDKNDIDLKVCNSRSKRLVLTLKDRFCFQNVAVERKVHLANRI